MVILSFFLHHILYPIPANNLSIIAYIADDSGLTSHRCPASFSLVNDVTSPIELIDFIISMTNAPWWKYFHVAPSEFSGVGLEIHQFMIQRSYQLSVPSWTYSLGNEKCKMLYNINLTNIKRKKDGKM